MHFADANLDQVNFDQVKLYMLAFCCCYCCLHFAGIAAACMHFAAAACIKLLDLFIVDLSYGKLQGCMHFVC
jgi:hypothetical protein